MLCTSDLGSSLASAKVVAFKARWYIAISGHDRMTLDKLIFSTSHRDDREQSAESGLLNCFGWGASVIKTLKCLPVKVFLTPHHRCVWLWAFDVCLTLAVIRVNLVTKHLYTNQC